MESSIIHGSSDSAPPFALLVNGSGFAQSISSQEPLSTTQFDQKLAIKRQVSINNLKSEALSLYRGTPDIFADFTDDTKIGDAIQLRDFSATQPLNKEADRSTDFVDSTEIFDAIRSLYLSASQPRDRAIATRITALYRDALAEEERILSASLRQFTAFFLAHPDLGLPKITLTPDGTLRVRWIQSAGSFTAIEFVGGEVAKLVAEIPRGEGVTAQHFIREHIQHIIEVARAIGAKFS